jgi:hypothetical protein
MQSLTIDDEQERAQFEDWAQEEYWDYKETYPRILLNSFHVSTVSLLESELFSIAKRIGQKQDDVSKIKGRDYIRSACNYIEKLTKIDCEKFTIWTEIVDGRTLRNIITHSNGIIEKPDDLDLARRYNVLNDSTLETLSVRTVQQVQITYEYSTGFLKSITQFFEQLFDSINAGKFL